MSLTLCFVAAPLVARSGVYNSTIELVRAARQRGFDWHAVIGVSADAGGEPTLEPGIEEIVVEPRGLTGVLDLRKALRSCQALGEADLLISMIPQSDMALSLGRRPWVAYLRGLPWPAPGEAPTTKARLWKGLEMLALSRAQQIWATTNTLISDVGGTVDKLVPPGLVPPPNVGPPTGHGKRFIWAARYGLDKNPRLFLQAMRTTGLPGVMYGTGPMEQELSDRASPNVDIAGWRPREEIWVDAYAYVGTSTREAFGRSAVEASMLGLPIVISKQFGCGDLLYTDPDLASLFVLDPKRPESWARAIHDLHHDPDLYRHAADHVKSNADSLTVDAALHSVLMAASEVISN